MLWTGPLDGVSDCTPALNAVTDAINAAGDVTLDFPAGQFSFLSPPKPLPRMTIRGQGKLATVFSKRFDGGALFTITGHRGDGIVLESFACISYAAYAPGYLAYIAGTADYQPDETVLRQIWCSSNDKGTWYTHVVLDGLARLSPQGLRDCLIEDCEFLNGVSASIWARDCVGLKVRGVGCFSGTGPAGGCGIYLTGGADVNHQSTRCYFEGVNNNGQLNISNSFQCSFQGSIGSLITDAVSSHWHIDASCPGPVSNQLKDSKVELW